MKRIFFLLILVPFFNCSSGKSEVAFSESAVTEESPDAAGKLYLVTTSRGPYLSIDWVWLGDDGTIVFNPLHGVDPVNIAEEQGDNAGSTGRYTIAGEAFNISWSNGKKDSWGFGKDGANYNTINGGIATLTKKLPAGYTISGQFTAHGANSAASYSNKLVFNKDGTLGNSRMGAVNTEQGTASSGDSNTGTYKITGNTIFMNFANGKKTTSVITQKDIGSKRYLIIDSEMYPEEK